MLFGLFVDPPTPPPLSPISQRFSASRPPSECLLLAAVVLPETKLGSCMSKHGLVGGL